MLHPWAVHLMEYGKSVGAKVGIITNGSTFNEESTRRLLDAYSGKPSAQYEMGHRGR